ncbi:hypothetical protein F5883DRAFT_512849 [Diaporthe sp. PMI_573]|nr:hypothetical protein F5883DRAFT_512849 [Diaporthaceae sp. PMI_573]
MDAESIKKSILEDSFVFIKNSEFGRMADAFANKGYPFQTEVGLDLLSEILRNEVRNPRTARTRPNISQFVRDTIESSLERCGLGMFKAFGPHPDSARALLNRTTDEMLALNVLLCRSGSRITLDKRSHMYELDAEPGGVGLLELPRGIGGGSSHILV